MASARMAFAMSRASWSTVCGAGFSDVVDIGLFRVSGRAALALDELQDERRQDQLHGEIELVARRHDGVRSRHERVRNHREQIRKVYTSRTRKADDDH